MVTGNGVIVFSNRKVEDLFGFRHAELAGRSIDSLVPERHRKMHEKVRADYVAAPSPRAMGEGRIVSGLTKNGEEVQLEVGLTPLQVGVNDYVLVSIVEVSNEILKVAAYHDPLTGLPNRNLFKEIGEKLRNLAIRSGDSLALAYVDLDGFKHVNDQYGHDVGDLVLREVAEILRNSVRRNDIVCRIGGDEFVMCLYGIVDKVAIEKLSFGVLEKISSVRDIGGNNVDISASIGVASTDKPVAVLFDDLIRIADRLMYEAKQTGKGRVVLEEC